MSNSLRSSERRKRLSVDRSVGEQAGQVSPSLKAGWEAKESKEKDRNGCQQLCCFYDAFFVPSVTTKDNLGKPLAGGLSLEGRMRSLKASLELFLPSRQMDKLTDSKLITKKGIILKEKQKAFFPLPSPKLSDTAKVTSPYSPSFRLLSDKKLSRQQYAR